MGESLCNLLVVIVYGHKKEEKFAETFNNYCHRKVEKKNELKINLAEQPRLEMLYPPGRALKMYIAFKLY